ARRPFHWKAVAFLSLHPVVNQESALSGFVFCFTLQTMPQRANRSLFELFRSAMKALLPILFVADFFFDVAMSAQNVSTDAGPDPFAETTNHLGSWIWEAHTSDKQTCRLWKSFVLPEKPAVLHATMRITVDNGFHLFFDGRDIAWGSDWRT